MSEIINFINLFIDLFFEMALYMMIGLFFVAILFIFFTKELIAKQMGKANIWSIIKAAMLGVPLPLCSCGVVPSAVYMSKSGASKGAVISFLTSTPQTGVDSIIATYGMMGPVFAVFRPLVALITGIFSGLFVQKIAKNEEIDTGNMDTGSAVSESSSIKERAKKAGVYAFVEFLDDITPQFLVGLLIAALITYFVPDSYFVNSQISNGILGMLVMIAIGAPMYICATSSIPIAVSLMLKGFSPGVAFVFLAVGPATNAASFAILMKVLGKKTALAYLLSLSVLSIIFGYILDYFFYASGINPLSMLTEVCNHEHHGGMHWTNMIFGSIFLIMILSSIYRLYIRKYIKKVKIVENQKNIKVSGMNCNHCVMNVTNAINSIEGVKTVKVDLSTESAVIDGDFDMPALKSKVESMGYKVTEL